MTTLRAAKIAQARFASIAVLLMLATELISIPARAADVLPANTRAWECIPGVIRNDGLETFRLEINTNGPVARVTVNSVPCGIVPPAPPPFDLRDDGASPDRVAGDYVYTAGPFKYDATVPMSPTYLGDSDSPAGLDNLPVGDISITETNGTVTHFLLGPSVGVLRSDIPAVVSKPLGPTLATTPHLINLQTATHETQSALRALGGDVKNLSAPIYQALPDAYHFLVFFSTDKLESLPRSSAQNYESGTQITVQVNYSGTGQAKFNNSPAYGSQGTLLGACILDAGSRGMSSGNLLHELMHQWVAEIDPTLGLTTSDGHYLPRTSAASLAGGQLWTRNPDSSYMLDCTEGRNGAHHAPPLDLYMMGLITASGVRPLYAYSSSSPLPLARCGQSFTDVVTTVTIFQILSKHGLRMPGPTAAPHHYNIAFVAESHNRLLSSTELTYYDLLAAAFTRRVPAGQPDPYVGSNWASIDRYFGNGLTWSSLVRPYGDFDASGHVDSADISHMQSCRTPAGAAQLTPGCQDADLDGDGDVDQEDFGLLQRCYTGPTGAIDPACAN